MEHLTDPQRYILRSAIFSGALGADDLTGYEGADLSADLAVLRARNLIEADALVIPTVEGKDALEARYARVRAVLPDEVRDEIIRRFRPLDHQIKFLASQWQQAAARDDWDAKLTVIEQLSELQEETLKFIAEYQAKLPSLPEFGSRLANALEKILSGEEGYVVGVRCSSYHTTWFELHEDLLRTLERQRDPE